MWDEDRNLLHTTFIFAEIINYNWENRYCQKKKNFQNRLSIRILRFENLGIRKKEAFVLKFISQLFILGKVHVFTLAGRNKTLTKELDDISLTFITALQLTPGLLIGLSCK